MAVSKKKNTKEGELTSSEEVHFTALPSQEIFLVFYQNLLVLGPHQHLELQKTSL